MDSEPVHWQCWAEVLAPAGIVLDWATYERDCIGVTDRAMLEALAPLASPPTTIDSLWPRYAEKRLLFRERMKTANCADVPTLEAIRSLNGLPMAVVTSSVRAEVEPVLDRLGILARLGTAVYGDEVERHKPHPEPYLTAASRLGASRPLVFEDSDAGVASATAAGFEVVRVKGPAEVGPWLRTHFVP